MPVAHAYFASLNVDGFCGDTFVNCGEVQHDIFCHCDMSVSGMNWFTWANVINVFIGAPSGMAGSVPWFVPGHEIAPYVHDVRACPPVQ